MGGMGVRWMRSGVGERGWGNVMMMGVKVYMFGRLWA